MSNYLLSFLFPKAVDAPVPVVELPEPQSPLVTGLFEGAASQGDSFDVRNLTGDPLCQLDRRPWHKAHLARFAKFL